MLDQAAGGGFGGQFGGGGRHAMPNVTSLSRSYQQRQFHNNSVRSSIGGSKETKKSYKV